MSRALVRLGLIAAALLVLITASPTPAYACTCAPPGTPDAWPTFAEVARSSPAAVVGRVTIVGPTEVWALTDPDPRYIDVDVSWVSKGSVDTPRVRIWNFHAGSSCGGAFWKTAVGTHLVAAVWQVGTKRYSISDVDSRDEDFVLEVAACGEGFLLLSTEEDLARYVGKKID